VKYEAETDQGVGDAMGVGIEIDQDRGKAQKHSKCAIIIALSVRKHTDASCHVSGRSHLQKKPQHGKLIASFGQRTKAGDAKTSRLTVMDKRNGIRYLIDTGADISVLPKTATRDKYTISKDKLYAANNTPITT